MKILKLINKEGYPEWSTKDRDFFSPKEIITGTCSAAYFAAKNPNDWETIEVGKYGVFVIPNMKYYDNLNHLDLRSDIENGNILETILFSEGKITTNTWSIACELVDSTVVENYLYESKMEFEEDLKILGLK